MPIFFYNLHNKELYISPFKVRIKVNSYQHNKEFSINEFKAWAQFQTIPLLEPSNGSLSSQQLTLSNFLLSTSKVEIQFCRLGFKIPLTLQPIKSTIFCHHPLSNGDSMCIPLP